MRAGIPKRVIAGSVVVALGFGYPVAAQAIEPFPVNPPANEAKLVRADPNENVTFYFGLTRDDAGASAQLARRSDPKSALYRHWLSLNRVKGYGAPSWAVKRLKDYLQPRGIKVRLDESRVMARVKGPVKKFERAFKTQLWTQDFGDLHVVGVKNAGPAMPSTLRSVVADAVWESVKQLQSDSQVSIASAGGPQPLLVPAPQNQGTPIDACQEIRDNSNVMTFAQAADAYGISKVRSRLGYGVKAKAKAPKIGIISMGSGFSQEAADKAAQCLGWQVKPAKLVKTDGMRTALPEGGEGDLDQQMMSAMLGRSNRITTYEALPSDLSGFLPLAAALGDHSRPAVLSISYGTCEKDLFNKVNRPYTKLSEAFLMRLGLTGTTTFVAAGDSGSSTCERSGQGDQASTSYPATSPYVTAVGGSRLVLNSANQRANEVVWNDSDFTGGNYSLVPGSNISGGGGGKSQLFKRPSWQPKKNGGGGYRTVPDITAHASGAPAWPIYINTPQSIDSATIPAGWFPVFGTSASSPLTAATFAMIVAKEQAAGKPRLGLINPWLYSIKKPYRQAFFDVVSGNNDLYHAGCCRAKSGYDKASGIGAPNFAELQRQIPKRG